METATIREAQRILKALIETGHAYLKSGHKLEPETQTLVGVIEKVAAKKVEEVEKPTEVTDFVPTGTYHSKPKIDA